MSYEVKLDAFEGPLDLLLHLINRLEIDIYDIPMADLTLQYMEHIRAMQVLELNKASEFLVMAASLLVIKSKLLLPIHEGDIDDDELVLDMNDPREELVNRLIEYRKYKEAAEKLQQLEEHRAQVFTRAPSDLTDYQTTKQLAAFDEPLNVFDMLGAFQKMMRRKILRAPLATKITRHELSIKDQMKSVFDTLKSQGGSCSFSELFPSEDKTTLVVTFLTILELMKRQMVRVEQHQNFDDLNIKLLHDRWEEESFEPIDE
ncbi:segregation/condensation protein A [Paenisporosarcina antarctica]|uniref:Segregation and condensation protein A n=1 Tax=Paenisporosarcina antarctica TaxID=417367 RepID=A0A4P6ZYM0_9BACL|nr:segregation/condensation protein A [Paenisporosarcina antarctica]QBP41374.1 segregation/condensation protein A [Paenisporosarcina antarctica]